ncbi:hypothetical protein GCM10010156_59870 [Planobispora rosea]|uniref:HTH luxR-type domain-containing protein n=1 Tax=Planobispora rosea TaxID=35762 RepID=A0A8J3WES8_PLARO|nr:hypothetical protein [Planobispora rosea]GGS93621.1 hypothetical protein GCM10010156_59870 [Planobispora rosea]GIH87289.1 hypothetical protein Pro02_56970 [Planobispora rosea]
MDLRLDQDAIDVYRYALSHEDWTPQEAAAGLGVRENQVRKAISVLGQLKLLRSVSTAGGVFDVVAPEAALAELLADEELELRRRQAQIASTRDQVMRLMPYYEEAQQSRRRAAVLDIVDNQTARHLLRDWSHRVREEVLVAHPGGGWERGELARSLENDLTLLTRGVRMRVVLQHATREHRPTRKWAERVGRAGAEIRTVSTVPRRQIVHDAARCLLPTSDGSGAVVVQEPGVVEFIVTVFEDMWSRAHPFPGAGYEEPMDGEKGKLIREAILRELATGAKDEVVARRLGLSLRTCRRRISEIMSLLGAENRFQAGVLARERVLLPTEDGTRAPGIM